MTLSDNPSWIALTRGTIEARSRAFGVERRTEPVSRELAAQFLATDVQRSVAAGARVEHATDMMAVLTYGNRPNHILHLLLTVFTFGAWAVVWIVAAVLGRTSRVMLTVDECGNISRSSVR